MSSAVDRLKLANEAHPPPANDANDFTLDLRTSNESAAKSENAKVGAAAGASSNANPRHPFVSIDSSISLGLTGDSTYVTKQLPAELKQQLSIEVRSQTTEVGGGVRNGGHVQDIRVDDVEDCSEASGVQNSEEIEARADDAAEASPPESVSLLVKT